MARYLSQKEQSAAPPAIVPKRKSLISITFFTYSDDIKLPMEALLSTATNTPSLYLNAKVVVP